MNSGTIRSYVEIGRYCSIGRNVYIGLGIHNMDMVSTSPFFGSGGENPSTSSPAKTRKGG